MTAVLIEIVIDPEGKAFNCVTLMVFGDEKLGRDICKLQGRAEFKPAISSTGAASYGIVRAFIRYIIIGTVQGRKVFALDAPGITHNVMGVRIRNDERFPDFDKFKKESGTPQIVALPDVTFDVQTLPDDVGKFLDQRVTVAIDTNGKVTECTAESQVGGYGTHSKYMTTACQLLQGMKMAAPLIIDDQPVSYVRPIDVRFAIADSS